MQAGWEHGLDLLLRLAEFLICQEQSRRQQLCQVATASSQEQPMVSSLTSTPTGDGGEVVAISSVSPSVVTSPSVAEYLRSMPKKSTVKSPLLKYKRMKQLRQQSPLKAAERQQRKKVVTRLNFEPSQHSNTPTSTVPETQVEAGAPSLLPPNHQSPPLPAPTPCSISDSPDKALHNNAKASGRVSKVFAAIAPRPSTATRPAENMVSAAKLNTEKEKKKDRPPQKVHLVTVSKKSLKSSGSFSRLDLSNLFTAVSQNLKDVRTEGSEKSGDKEKESDLQQQQQQMSRSPVLLATNTSASSVPATLISSTRAVATSRQSSASGNHTNPSDPPSPRVPVTTNSTAGPPQSLAPATAGGEPPHPSPLEQLASQVASHPLPPPSVTSSPAASQMYKIYTRDICTLLL